MQQLVFARVVGRLEPAEQFIERVEHLLGQTFADFILVLPTVFEEGG